jgi:hypothetical protein
MPKGPKGEKRPADVIGRHYQADMPGEFADAFRPVDQRRANALGQRLRSPRILNNVVMQRQDPAGARVFSRAISSPRTCSAESIPSAIGEGKMRSAFEFIRTMPRPSSRSGESTIGKTLAQSSVNA